jgi:hypothetical protein
MPDAATSAMTATDDSMSMEPYPIIRTCVSFWIVFGVVLEAISEWKPDRAARDGDEDER